MIGKNLRVLVAGLEGPSESDLLLRLSRVSGILRTQTRLCYELAESHLMVIHGNAALLKTAKQMVERHSKIPLWLHTDDGHIFDALKIGSLPLNDVVIAKTIEDLVGSSTRAPDSFADSMRFHLKSGRARGAIYLDDTPVINVDFKTLSASPITFSRLPADQFATLLGASYEKLTFRETDTGSIEREYADANADAAQMPLIPLLWRTALRQVSKLEMIQPMKEDSAFRLRQWPDFRVLGHRHEDFRLCSLLLKRTSTVEECQRLLGIDRSAVCSLLNAAYLSGYASIVEGSRRPLELASKKVSKGQGSLLASMWRSVRKRISA